MAKPTKEKNQIYEFLIVFNLPKWVEKYVVQLKDEFADTFGPFPSRHSVPHITLSKFPYLIQNQDTILLMLQDTLYKASPTQIELNGFGVFLNSRVIYIHVEPSDELNGLRSPFYHIRDLYDYNKKGFHVFDKLHVTVARGLRKDVFEAARSKYLPQRYQSSFLKTKLTVLRREVKGNGKFGFYEEVTDLTLGGQL